MPVCNRCGGTQSIPYDELTDEEAEALPRPPSSPSSLLGVRSSVPCPTCTPFGPFGVVPDWAVIETALQGREGSKNEQVLKQMDKGRRNLEWLLNDGPSTCGECDGTGFWAPGHLRQAEQARYRKQWKRVCFHCDGAGKVR